MIKAMESSGSEIFSVCEEARDSIYIVAVNYRKQGDDTETLNSGWCGEPIKHNRIVNGISSVYLFTARVRLRLFQYRKKLFH